MMKGIEAFSQKIGVRHREHSPEMQSEFSDDYYDSGDEESDEHSLPVRGPSHSAAGAALPASEEPAEFLGFPSADCQLSVPVEVHVPSSAVPRVTGCPVHPAPPVVQPQLDESLPRKQFRPSKNWNP